jgi:hypothetical protein
MNALTKGSVIKDELIYPSKWTRLMYSIIIFMPDRKRVIEMQQPAKMPRSCLCQPEGAPGVKDLDQRPA